MQMDGLTAPGQYQNMEMIMDFNIPDRDAQEDLSVLENLENHPSFVGPRPQIPRRSTPHLLRTSSPRLPSSHGCSTPTPSGRGFLTRITTLKTGRWPSRTCVPWKTSTQT